MQRSLALMALGATVAVGSLCAVAAAAYGVEPRDEGAVAVHSAALIVPLGYEPSKFAPSAVQPTQAGLVRVAPHRALPATGATSNSPGASAPAADPEPAATTGPKPKPTPGTKPDKNDPIETPSPELAKPTPTAKPTKPGKDSNDGNGVGIEGKGSNNNSGPGNGDR